MSNLSKMKLQFMNMALMISKENGLSVTEIAEFCNVSKSVVVRWKNQNEIYGAGEKINKRKTKLYHFSEFNLNSHESKEFKQWLTDRLVNICTKIILGVEQNDVYGK